MWIPACKRDDVDPDDVIGFEYDGADYAIFRSPDDRYFATAGHCTHERELLCDGLVMDGEIECPKHLGRFSYATGEAQGAPVLVDLKTYPVKLEDDTVYLDIS
jgi:3-phenylpropionate/trans-cinnamate dioxygenase ferredoxin subunit